MVKINGIFRNMLITIDLKPINIKFDPNLPCICEWAGQQAGPPRPAGGQQAVTRPPAGIASTAGASLPQRLYMMYHVSKCI